MAFKKFEPIHVSDKLALVKYYAGLAGYRIKLVCTGGSESSHGPVLIGKFITEEKKWYHTDTQKYTTKLDARLELDLQCRECNYSVDLSELGDIRAKLILFFGADFHRTSR